MCIGMHRINLLGHIHSFQHLRRVEINNGLCYRKFAPPHIVFYKVFTQSLKESFERFCRYQMSVLTTVYAFMLSVLQVGIHAKFCVTVNKLMMLYVC
jgi:hypothetical protein